MESNLKGFYQGMEHVRSALIWLLSWDTRSSFRAVALPIRLSFLSLLIFPYLSRILSSPENPTDRTQNLENHNTTLHLYHVKLPNVDPCMHV